MSERPDLKAIREAARRIPDGPWGWDMDTIWYRDGDGKWCDLRNHDALNEYLDALHPATVRWLIYAAEERDRLAERGDCAACASGFPCERDD